MVESDSSVKKSDILTLSSDDFRRFNKKNSPSEEEFVLIKMDAPCGPHAKSTDIFYVARVIKDIDDF